MSEKLEATDFGLPPIDFVRRVFEIKLGKSAIAADETIDYLAYRIMQGTPRLEIISAVERLANGATDHVDTMPGCLNLVHQPFLNYDILEAFAPDDHDAFIDFCSERMLGKALPSAVRINASFELRKGTLTRRQFIDWLSKCALYDGQALDLFELSPATSTVELRDHVVSDGGRERGYVFARRYQNGMTVFSDQYWHQPLCSKANDYVVRPGWLFTGPKKNLPAGFWTLGLDLAQARHDELVIDIVADCGLTTLLHVVLEGPCMTNLKYRVKPEHSFIEVRMLRPDKCGIGTLQINDFSLRRAD